MKKKETEETGVTVEMDTQSTFHQKLDRELNFNLKMKHSTRDPRHRPHSHSPPTPLPHQSKPDHASDQACFFPRQIE